ncbi:MAG: hypothetical protein D6B27_05560, partial [Gammaproteobacteria bacterium]
QEIENIKEQIKQQGGQAPEDLDFEKEGRTRVTLALLIRKIIEDNDIKIDDSRVDAMLKRVASSYGDPTIIMQYYQNNPELMQNFRSAVLEEQVIEFVAEKGNIAETEMTFEELAKSPITPEDEE